MIAIDARLVELSRSRVSSSSSIRPTLIGSHFSPSPPIWLYVHTTQNTIDDETSFLFSLLCKRKLQHGMGGSNDDYYYEKEEKDEEEKDVFIGPDVQSNEKKSREGESIN